MTRASTGKQSTGADGRGPAGPDDARVHRDRAGRVLEGLPAGRTGLPVEQLQHLLPAVQRAAGNRAASRLVTVQRRAKLRGRSNIDQRASTAETFVVCLDDLMQSEQYGPDSARGLPPRYSTYLSTFYQAIYGRKYGAPDVELSDQDRQTQVLTAQMLVPPLIVELADAPDGDDLVKRLQRRLEAPRQQATYHSMMDRAYDDRDLEAKLRYDPDVVKARESSLSVLGRAYEVYSKYAEGLSDAAEKQEKGPKVAEGFLPAALGRMREGLDNAIALVKAVDPGTYRDLFKELREWVGDHHGGTATAVKATAVAAELAEVTVGASVKVGQGLTHLALKAAGHTLEDVKELEKLDDAGELVTSSGEVAIWAGKALEFLDNVDKGLAVAGVIGGVATFVTAETTGEKVDAAVQTGTGVVATAAKFAPEEAAWAAPAAIGAGSVLASWEMTKFVFHLAGGGIEGSMYGGLAQELGDIRPLGDQVAQALVSLQRALDERDRRFADVDPDTAALGPNGPEVQAANDVVDKLAYQLCEKLDQAETRWRNSPIPALRAHLPSEHDSGVSWLYQPDGPPASPYDLAGAATTFLQALLEAWKDRDEIVVHMLHDQGFLNDKEMRLRERRLHADEQEDDDAAKAAAADFPSR